MHTQAKLFDDECFSCTWATSVLISTPLMRTSLLDNVAQRFLVCGWEASCRDQTASSTWLAADPG